MSRASMPFLQRQRMFPVIVQHIPMFRCCSLLSHYRPIRPATGLVPADRVMTRVVTQKEEERVPYQCCPKVQVYSGCC